MVRACEQNALGKYVLENIGQISAWKKKIQNAVEALRKLGVNQQGVEGDEQR